MTDCDRKHLQHGFCKMHYARWLKYGDPTIVKRVLNDNYGRFMSWVAKDDTPSGCWLWTGSTKGPGYGQFSVGSRRGTAHRWSYEHHVGPIPAGLELDHLCRNPSCVNPDHLEAVTHAENMRRIRGLRATRGK